VSTRQEGTSRFYARNGALEPGADRLWSVVAEDLRGSVEHRRDGARLGEVVGQRRAKSREFFAGASGSWDDIRQELFGSAVGGGALLGLLDDDWVVGDLGCGADTYRRAGTVRGGCPRSRRFHRYAGPGQARLASWPSIELRAGELEALLIGDGELDAAIISLVLHHSPEPRRVIGEAMRVLKVGAGCFWWT
jgi:ArsR family transcriptional regulator